MSQTEAVSHWDQRRELHADRLQKIAHELFVRDGYPSVSVEDIAAAAGVSARTFHRYFPSKQDVLLKPLEEMDQAMVDRLELLSRPRSPLREIRNIYIELTEQAADLDAFRMWRRALRTAPQVEARALGESRRRLMHTLRAVFAEWLGVDPRTDVRPDSISAAVLAVNEVAVSRYLQSNGRADLVALFVEAFEFLDRGLRGYATWNSHRDSGNGRGTRTARTRSR